VGDGDGDGGGDWFCGMGDEGCDGNEFDGELGVAPPVSGDDSWWTPIVVVGVWLIVWDEIDGKLFII